MSRTFSIVKAVDLDRLDREINTYINVTGERNPYIFMSNDTADAIANVTNPLDVFWTRKDFNVQLKTGARGEYIGYSVFVNDNLKFGEIEIR